MPAKTVEIALPTDTVQALDRWASDEERPRSALLRLIVRRAVDDWRQQGLPTAPQPHQHP